MEGSFCTFFGLERDLSGSVMLASHTTGLATAKAVHERSGG